MDVGSIVSGLVAAKTGQIQLEVAAKLMETNADSAQSVSKLIDAAQRNADKLASVAAGIGTKLDITA
jgi:hypothetical protein